MGATNASEAALGAAVRSIQRMASDNGSVSILCAQSVLTFRDHKPATACCRKIAGMPCKATGVLGMPSGGGWAVSDAHPWRNLGDAAAGGCTAACAPLPARRWVDNNTADSQLHCALRAAVADNPSTARGGSWPVSAACLPAFGRA